MTVQKAEMKREIEALVDENLHLLKLIAGLSEELLQIRARLRRDARPETTKPKVVVGHPRPEVKT